MKKILAILLVLVMVLALVACGNAGGSEGGNAGGSEGGNAGGNEGGNAGGNEGGAASGNGYKLMLSNAYYTAPYCAAYNPAATAKAEEYGCTLEILDGAGNQQTQLEHANLAIAEKYDGFLYFPADVDGALPVIEALNDGGIAWVGVNAYTGDAIDEVGMKYYVGPDAASHGTTQGKTLVDMFPDGCNYVTIAGVAGHMQTIEMDKAFAKEVDPAKWISLDYQNADFNAEISLAKMADMLTSYGLACDGGKIDVIIIQDGGMTTGVISALESAGYKPGDVPLIAMGSNLVLYDAMMDGWLSASSTQDPSAEGALAVEVLYGVLTGTAEPGWTKLPTPVAYPETADNFAWF